MPRSPVMERPTSPSPSLAHLMRTLDQLGTAMSELQRDVAESIARERARRRLMRLTMVAIFLAALAAGAFIKGFVP